MISGVGLAGVKSECTEKDGWARRVSKSSLGLVFEDEARFVDTFANGLGWRLMVWMALSQCQCLRVIAQVSLTNTHLSLQSEDVHNSVGILEFEIHRAEILALYQGFRLLRNRERNVHIGTNNLHFDAFIKPTTQSSHSSSIENPPNRYIPAQSSKPHPHPY